MTGVRFVVTVDFDSPSRLVWDELVDWKAHEAWIPATRVEVDGDGPTALGRDLHRVDRVRSVGARGSHAGDRMRLGRRDPARLV